MSIRDLIEVIPEWPSGFGNAKGKMAV